MCGGTLHASRPASRRTAGVAKRGGCLPPGLPCPGCLWQAGGGTLLGFAALARRNRGIRLSLIICTRNRAGNLAAMLAALDRVRSDAAWEVLLVDNASTDGTPATLAAAARTNPRLRVLHVAQVGLGAARDAAWRAAAGEIVAFTDDDCYVAPDFVDAILAAFADRPGVACLGGRILLFDPDDHPVTIDLRDVPARIPARSFVPAGALQGANLAFRRSALERIGGVDPDLGAGTPFPCEDIDAVAAVAWSGLESGFDPRPVVHHHHGRKAADYPQLMAGYDRGRGAYYAKYLLPHASRAAYIAGWRADRMNRVDRGSLVSFARELRSAARYLVHRRRFGFLVAAAPVASAHFAVLAGRVAIGRLRRALGLVGSLKGVAA